MSEFAKLLGIIGRQPDEPCTILTQAPGATGLEVHWTTVAEAPSIAMRFSGTHNIWFGVQPVRVSSGRGKANDVVGLRTLYADLDDKNMTREQAMSIIGHLSNTLGVGCGVFVVSGGGIQPYWPIEEMGPIEGADLLLWWREQVIAAAAIEGVSVDTGVYDLARILRVPGPPNMKPAYGADGARTGLVCTGSGWKISHDELLAAVQKNPAARTTRVRVGGGGFAPERRGDSAERSDDRVFTPEQAMAYLERDGGPVRLARATPHGSGFNDALNRAAFEIAAFVPVFLTEEEAWDLASGIVESQFPGGPDGNDVATIRSGFSQVGWSARRPTEDEQLNPFGLHADVEKIRSAQGGIKAAGQQSPRQAERAAVTAGADAAVASVQRNNVASGGIVAPELAVLGIELGGVDENGKPRPEAACYLPEEFWAARPLFQHLRRAAQHAMASPEGVLLAGLALIAARTMPNVKLGAPIGTPASLNHMFVLCGDSADGKSTCRKVAKEAIRLDDGVAPWHSFGPSSGQGVAGQFQRLARADRNAPPMLERTRYAAFAHVEESDTMQALLANKTNTIGAVLRQGAFGEELSYGNIGDTQTNLPEHSYRLIFWMCMQPELSDWLLGTAAGGLPQRFVWGCVRDPRIVEVDNPGIFNVRVAMETMPDPVSMRPKEAVVMGYTDRIHAEIREAARQRKIHGNAAGAEFDGHSMLNRFKVAGHIALADGRLTVTDEDWDLAGMVMQTSSAALGWVRAVVAWAGAIEANKAALGRGRGRVIEESVVKAADESAARKRVADSVLGFLGRAGAEGVTKSEIRRKLKSDLRHLLDDEPTVLTALLETGQVRFDNIFNDHGKQVGSRWFKV